MPERGGARRCVSQKDKVSVCLFRLVYGLITHLVDVVSAAEGSLTLTGALGVDVECAVSAGCADTPPSCLVLAYGGVRLTLRPTRWIRARTALWRRRRASMGMRLAQNIQRVARRRPDTAVLCAVQGVNY